ncbi:MAG: tRNA uridine-5-carboxymethylaminomethyl(34) synthesis GTPase MnmE [Firmicutes bacterium]|nr:tRNA uridine-5-carboxymethylaminomethyl(34) synthesis GTPase MnmE [Bacillota bacterium]
MTENKVIAAVSTPPGRGGIAVIRISGEGAVEIASKFFVPRSGAPLTAAHDRRAVYGEILSAAGEMIDTGIATVFYSPHSYTGEDTVEISCHGGVALTREVLASAFAAGCAPAGPGEFTRRAFVNGKLSLTEAEAVIGLIDAESGEAIRLSAAQARGVLSGRLKKLTDEITSLTASIYAYIDYPDEDMTDMPQSELYGRICGLQDELKTLCGSYRTGRAICEGIPSVIIGKPNVGKSSLLNCLLGRDRAIVTDIPGTTRDTVEETASIDGVLLRLCDTAGIREPKDEVERLGTVRTGEKTSEAELVLGVFDISRPIDGDDEKAAALINEAVSRGAEAVILLNKSELAEAFDEESIKKLIPEAKAALRISVHDGSGIDALRGLIRDMFGAGDISYSDAAVLTNARQYAAVSKALGFVSSARETLDAGFTADVAGTDLEAALSALEETDGRAVAESIVGEIFSRFCVGK